MGATPNLAQPQEALPDAAVAPVAALGEFSKGELRILRNRLDNELAKYLIPILMTRGESIPVTEEAQAARAAINVN